MFFYKHVNNIVEHEIENTEVLNDLVKKFKAIIAGGASHALMRGHTIQEYQTRHKSADVDLYFRSKEDYESAVCHVLSLQNDYTHIEKSVTGMCYNIYSEASTINKIQLVGCIFGCPEEIISSFDFKNLESCCFFEAGSYKLMYSENAKNSKGLIIRHSRSPFLMHRVYKYLNYRGYECVTKESKPHISDWIIKASSGYYEDNPDGCPSIYVDLLNSFHFISMIKDREIISDEDLVYMVGKIKERIYKETQVMTSVGYCAKYFHQIGSKDLVIEEIKKRSSIDAGK